MPEAVLAWDTSVTRILFIPYSLASVICHRKSPGSYRGQQALARGQMPKLRVDLTLLQSCKESGHIREDCTTETAGGPAKPECFAVWSFAEEVCRILDWYSSYQSLTLRSWVTRFHLSFQWWELCVRPRRALTAFCKRGLRCPGGDFHRGRLPSHTSMCTFLSIPTAQYCSHPLFGGAYECPVSLKRGRGRCLHRDTW